MDLITMLKSRVGDAVFYRGSVYAREGRVRRFAFREEEADPPLLHMEGTVRGSHRAVYRVSLTVTREGDPVDVSCTCPYFTERGLICKHIVALALVGQNTLRQSHNEKTPVGEVLGLMILDTRSRLVRVPVYRGEGWREVLKGITPTREMTISARKIQTPPPFLNLSAEEAREVFTLFRKRKLLQNLARFPELPVWVLARPDLLKSMRIWRRWRYEPPPSPLWPLPGPYRFVLDVDFEGTEARLFAGIRVGTRLLREEALQIFPLDGDRFLLITEGDRMVFLVGDDAAQWEDLVEFVREYAPRLKKVRTTPELELHARIVPAALEAFAGSPVDLFPSLPIEVVEVKEPPRPRLHLQWDPEKGLLAHLEIAYEEENTDLPISRYEDFFISIVVTRTLWRYLLAPSTLEMGAMWYERLCSREGGLKRAVIRGKPWGMQLRKSVSLETFLVEYVPRIAAMGVDVVGLEDLPVRVVRTSPRVRLWTRWGIDWLEGEVRWGSYRYTLDDFLRLFDRSSQAGEGRILPLAKGEIGVIPESLERFLRWIRRVSRMHRDMALRLLHRVGEEEVLDLPVEIPDIRPEIHDPEGLDPSLPATFQSTLRPYQVAGYRWLHALHARGLGGILADDMGLGKTVQVIAFLLYLRERGHPEHPDLVVVPRSLLFNWEQEIRRFAPSLTVGVYHGPDRPSLDALEDRDVVLTTYGTLLRDIRKFRKHRFHYVILDEAQVVKNPLSQTARSVRAVVSDHRLCLTGTPVENSPMDLWALMDFLFPGYLGTLREFKREYAVPILQGDTRAASTLQRLVHPWILRRTKEQVAQDLPPRVEEVIWCAMTPEQEAAYHETRSRLYEKLKQGEGKPLEILRALTLLRQMALHPSLVLAGYNGGSGKLDLLRSMLETLAAEGRKVLIYSQFVKFLDMLREEMEKRGLGYVMLTGRTRNRKKVVERFQKDPKVLFFLLSLKAGGVGLNLTAADTVILADPWWNPQVEQQAVDRAHRIGQRRTVFVLRLVTRDTVEEKVRILQERKRALAESLIREDAQGMKGVDWEEVVDLLFSRMAR